MRGLTDLTTQSQLFALDFFDGCYNSVICSSDKLMIKNELWQFQDILTTINTNLKGLELDVKKFYLLVLCILRKLLSILMTFLFLGFLLVFFLWAGMLLT